MQKYNCLIILFLLFLCGFLSSTFIHHDHKKATSYQHIEMEHFHPVSTYIKGEDRELFLKHPVSSGKTSTNLEVEHDETNHFKQVENEDIKHNHRVKHPVHPSYQGNDDHILGLGAYSSSNGNPEDYQYEVNEDLRNEEGDLQENYIQPQHKTIDDYKLNLIYGSDNEEQGSILEGTPEYEAYQKLAQAALLEYEQQIDPVYQHQRERRS